MTFEQIPYLIIAILVMVLGLVLLRIRKGATSAGDQYLQAAINQLSGQIKGMQDGFSKTLTDNISATSQRTNADLAKLNERLAVINQAQDNIQTLAKDVVGLQAILQNKQTRGAFGQQQMETIISDKLHSGQYEFQATLSNNNRPDCLIKMPNNSPDLVVDAKFPLEAWSRLRSPEAASDNEMLKSATSNFRTDMKKHIKDISEKYLIAGETQDIALLFIPSESIFAEIYENFDDLIQISHKARVTIVSPTHLYLSICVFQSMLKNTKTLEQANLIQKQVGEFMEDLIRLEDRISKLKNHNDLTTKDIDSILVSTRKLSKHGEKINELEFEEKSQSSTSADLLDTRE